MTEIEKLYELAGVEPKEFCDRDSDLCMSCCPEWNNRKNCWKYKSIIPPFTAEKQIELIKLLCTLGQFECYKNYYNDDWVLRSTYNMELDTYRYCTATLCFEESLAKLVISIWQDLTEAEQNEIRRILE